MGPESTSPVAHRLSLGGSLGTEMLEASLSSRDGSFVWPGLLCKHGTHAQHLALGRSSPVCAERRTACPLAPHGQGAPNGFLVHIPHVLSRVPGDVRTRNVCDLTEAGRADHAASPDVSPGASLLCGVCCMSSGCDKSQLRV